MRQRRIFSFLLTIFVAASFCLGLAFREVMAAVSPVLLAQGGLPERLAHVRPVSVSGDPRPADTYSRVLSEVKENYYGELPSDQTLTYEAIKGMLRTLDDVYTRFLDPEAFKAMDEENQGEFVGIGAQLEKDTTKDGYIRIHFPLPDTPAAKAGIKPGDVILKVDGKSVQTKDIGDPKHVDDVVKLIRGLIDTPDADAPAQGAEGQQGRPGQVQGLGRHDQAPAGPAPRRRARDDGRRHRLRDPAAVQRDRGR